MKIKPTVDLGPGPTKTRCYREVIEDGKEGYIFCHFLDTTPTGGQHWCRLYDKTFMGKCFEAPRRLKQCKADKVNE